MINVLWYYECHPQIRLYLPKCIAVVIRELMNEWYLFVTRIDFQLVIFADLLDNTVFVV